jgi:hypothetical protein
MKVSYISHEISDGSGESLEVLYISYKTGNGLVGFS